MVSSPRPSSPRETRRQDPLVLEAAAGGPAPAVPLQPAAAAEPAAAPEPPDAAAALLEACRRDPLRWVEEAFAWDRGRLAGHAGPQPWQREALAEIGRRLTALPEPGREGEEPDDTGAAIRLAIASGHGIGKSAFVAWLILWALTTRPDTQVVVTANTETQLRTKTWVQLATWHRRCRFSKGFKLSGLSLAAADPGHARTWRCDAVPWNETNPEAFAGLHNQGGRILLVFDEASAIPDVIWETAEGALTDRDTEILWLVAGNPTKASGRFRECFGRYAHRWSRRQIDSRSVGFTNKAQIAQWVEDYGEDSDFVRVRVRGVFPRVGTAQFVASDLVEQAQAREAAHGLQDPVVVGVDVARYGGDETVIAVRVGRDARTHAWIPLRGLDSMQVAARVVEVIRRLRPDAVVVDGGGVGAGVVDRLREVGHPVIEANFGGRADDPRVYADKGAEMWGRLRDWLAGGALPADPLLRDQLVGREYGYSPTLQIRLERKQDMKARGLASPDRADALALTFWAEWGARDPGALDPAAASGLKAEWNPFEE